MSQLAAFLSATMGDSFTVEAVLLLLYVLLINIRHSVWATSILSGGCGIDARRVSTPEAAGASPAPGSTAIKRPAPAREPEHVTNS